METEILKLIAVRVPVGDNWRLVSEGKNGPIYTPLTEALEAHFKKTKSPCDFRLSPMKGELYAIETKIEEVEPQKFSIYGDY
jgi:hypothetical protein